MNLRKTTFSPAELKDVCMVFAIVGILFHNAYPYPSISYFMIGLLLLGILRPSWAKPLGLLWYGLAYGLNLITSPIVLGAIYIILVCPIGIIRRLMRRDPLMLRHWKTSEDSILKTRNVAYSQSDLTKPF